MSRAPGAHYLKISTAHGETYCGPYLERPAALQEIYEAVQNPFGLVIFAKPSTAPLPYDGVRIEGIVFMRRRNIPAKHPLGIPGHASAFYGTAEPLPVKA